MNKKTYQDPASIIESILRRAVDTKTNFYHFSQDIDNLDFKLRKVDV